MPPGLFGVPRLEWDEREAPMPLLGKGKKEDLQDLMKRGKFKQAIKLLEDKLKQNPLDFGLKMRLAEAYDGDNRKADAARIYAQEAELLLSDGKLGDAASYFKKALKFTPGDEALKARLAQAERKGQGAAEEDASFSFDVDMREGTSEQAVVVAPPNPPEAAPTPEPKPPVPETIEESPAEEAFEIERSGLTEKLVAAKSPKLEILPPAPPPSEVKQEKPSPPPVPVPPAAGPPPEAFAPPEPPPPLRPVEVPAPAPPPVRAPEAPAPPEPPPLLRPAEVPAPSPAAPPPVRAPEVPAPPVPQPVVPAAETPAPAAPVTSAPPTAPAPPTPQAVAGNVKEPVVEAPPPEAEIPLIPEESPALLEEIAELHEDTLSLKIPVDAVAVVAEEEDEEGDIPSAPVEVVPEPVCPTHPTEERCRCREGSSPCVARRDILELHRRPFPRASLRAPRRGQVGLQASPGSRRAKS